MRASDMLRAGKLIGTSGVADAALVLPNGTVVPSWMIAVRLDAEGTIVIEPRRRWRWVATAVGTVLTMAAAALFAAVITTKPTAPGFWGTGALLAWALIINIVVHAFIWSRASRLVSRGMGCTRQPTAAGVELARLEGGTVAGRSVGRLRVVSGTFVAPGRRNFVLPVTQIQIVAAPVAGDPLASCPVFVGLTVTRPAWRSHERRVSAACERVGAGTDLVSVGPVRASVSEVTGMTPGF